MIAELEGASLRPVARTRAAVPLGGVFMSEFWVDPTGATVADVGATPSSEDLYFVSTYFVDGTAITVQQPGITLNKSDRRTLIEGSLDLAHNVRLAVDAREARIRHGGRPLLVVDVETARLHSEVHARLIAAKSPVFKGFNGRDAARVFGVVVLTVVVYLLTDWTTVLAIGSALTAVLVYLTFVFRIGADDP